MDTRVQSLTCFQLIYNFFSQNARANRNSSVQILVLAQVEGIICLVFNAPTARFSS